MSVGDPHDTSLSDLRYTKTNRQASERESECVCVLYSRGKPSTCV